MPNKPIPNPPIVSPIGGGVIEVQQTGVSGQASGDHGFGLLGISFDSKSAGFVGGTDPTFTQPAGVYGQSTNQGVMGLATVDSGTGVFGGGQNRLQFGGIGVRGETISGVGVQGQSFGSGLAAKFIGNVEVHGDVLLVNQDCAEDFDIAESSVDPGSVVVLDEVGLLHCCTDEYDKRVAGVISGAGTFRPGIVLGKRQSEHPTMPVALVGKAFCKVDADCSPIAVGDALTTSATPGHAMKATDREKAFGAVIGKALGHLESGKGMIPMLITLQ